MILSEFTIITKANVLLQLYKQHIPDNPQFELVSDLLKKRSDDLAELMRSLELTLFVYKNYKFQLRTVGEEAVLIIKNHSEGES